MAAADDSVDVDASRSSSSSSSSVASMSAVSFDARVKSVQLCFLRPDGAGPYMSKLVPRDKLQNCVKTTVLEPLVASAIERARASDDRSSSVVHVEVEWARVLEGVPPLSDVSMEKLMQWLFGFPWGIQAHVATVAAAADVVSVEAQVHHAWACERDGIALKALVDRVVDPVMRGKTARPFMLAFHALGTADARLCIDLANAAVTVEEALRRSKDCPVTQMILGRLWFRTWFRRQADEELNARLREIRAPSAASAATATTRTSSSATESATTASFACFMRELWRSFRGTQAARSELEYGTADTMRLLEALDLVLKLKLKARVLVAGEERPTGVFRMVHVGRVPSPSEVDFLRQLEADERASYEDLMGVLRTEVLEPLIEAMRAKSSVRAASLDDSAVGLRADGVRRPESAAQVILVELVAWACETADRRKFLKFLLEDVVRAAEAAVPHERALPHGLIHWLTLRALSAPELASQVEILVQELGRMHEKEIDRSRDGGYADEHSAALRRVRTYRSARSFFETCQWFCYPQFLFKRLAKRDTDVATEVTTMIETVEKVGMEVYRRSGASERSDVWKKIHEAATSVLVELAPTLADPRSFVLIATERDGFARQGTVVGGYIYPDNDDDCLVGYTMRSGKPKPKSKSSATEDKTADDGDGEAEVASDSAAAAATAARTPALAHTFAFHVMEELRNQGSEASELTFAELAKAFARAERGPTETLRAALMRTVVAPIEDGLGLWATKEFIESDQSRLSKVLETCLRKRGLARFGQKVLDEHVRVFSFRNLSDIALPSCRVLLMNAPTTVELWETVRFARRFHKVLAEHSAALAIQWLRSLVFLFTSELGDAKTLDTAHVERFAGIVGHIFHDANFFEAHEAHLFLDAVWRSLRDPEEGKWTNLHTSKVLRAVHAFVRQLDVFRGSEAVARFYGEFLERVHTFSATLYESHRGSVLLRIRDRDDVEAVHATIGALIEDNRSTDMPRFVDPLSYECTEYTRKTSADSSNVFSAWAVGGGGGGGAAVGTKAVTAADAAVTAASLSMGYSLPVDDDDIDDEA